MNTPVVFVSYCHDPNDSIYKTKVKSLADSLRTNGVRCEIDQYNSVPEEGWPKWILKLTQEADYLLVVFSPTYKAKALGTQINGNGSGVEFEFTLLLGDLYKNNTKTKKIIPIVFKEEDQECIIPPFNSFTWYDLSKNAGFRELYKKITKQNNITPPEIGSIIMLDEADDRIDDPVFKLEPSYNDYYKISDPNSFKAIKEEETYLHVKIDMDFNKFTSYEQNKFLEAIASLSGIPRSKIHINNLKKGSVIVEIKLNAALAEKLLWAIKSGELDYPGIINAEISSKTIDENIEKKNILSKKLEPANPLTKPTYGEIGDLICFSHLRWNFIYQRPQHLLKRATKNYRVWFVEEPIWNNILQMSITHETERLTILTPHLPHGTGPKEVILLQKQLLDELLSRERITNFVIWYYNPMAFLFSDHLRPLLTVYDCMNELSSFWGAPPQLLEVERQLMNKADVIFTGGYSIYEDKRNRHPHVFAFPSSIDFTHFSSARKPQPDPTDQRQLATPRIGFSGVIDERFDYELLSELAQRRPEWQFVLLGPIVNINPDLLPHGPNVHYLGMKAYMELPMYFSNWDVAIMPFALNDSTRFISPTKTPEYLAAGLPVVSTPIRDIVRVYGVNDFVQIADTEEAFEMAILKALDGKHPMDWSKIDAFLNENSWDKTWNQMYRLMVSAIGLAIKENASADTYHDQTKLSSKDTKQQ